MHKLCMEHAPFWPKNDDQRTLTLNISLTKVPIPVNFGTINLETLKNKLLKFQENLIIIKLLKVTVK